jgi:hypothetical protein
MLLIILASSVPRLVVRRTAPLTIEPRVPLVQPTLGSPRLGMSRAEGRGRRTTSLRTLHYARRIQYNIPMRRAIRRIHPLQTPLTRQGTVPTEGMTLQLKQPIGTIKSLWK